MKIRTSGSIISFKEGAENTFGLKEWQGIDDPDQELLFFGLYHERDYDVFDCFKGKKSVLWAGTDITRLLEDYERKRVIKNNPCDHYCENEIEAQELRSLGLNPIVIPSFLDNINKFPVSFNPPVQYDGETRIEQFCKVWMCAHPDREDEYGVPSAKRMAELYPLDLQFHIYGVEKQAYDSNLPNVIYHGQVSKEQLNEEIKEYHCGFRPNFHDGFSEVIIKSILLGQYPISRIKYEHVWNYTSETQLKECFDKLLKIYKPNLEARTYWLKQINQYPWCKKEYYEPSKV